MFWSPLSSFLDAVDEQKQHGRPDDMIDGKILLDVARGVSWMSGH